VLANPGHASRSTGTRLRHRAPDTRLAAHGVVVLAQPLGAGHCHPDGGVPKEVTMDVVILIGRILFAFAFAGASVGHLTQTDAMAGYAQSKGVPAGIARVVVFGSGVMILACAISVVLGLWGDLGALLLVIFLASTAFIMHNFWAATDPQEKQLELTQFSKDLSLAGGALVLLAVFSRDVDLTLTGPLLNLA
jgi:putative oxidoreductase